MLASVRLLVTRVLGLDGDGVPFFSDKNLATDVSAPLHDARPRCEFNGTKGEFKDLGIKTREDFAKHIDKVVSRANGADVRQLSGGRSAYWDQASGTVVIRNPSAPAMGTAFRSDGGRMYFEGLK